MTESERIRKLLGVSRAEFSRRYNIPIRTLEDWDWGKKTPPEYVIELLEKKVRDDISYGKWIGNKYLMEGSEWVITEYTDGLFIITDGVNKKSISPDEITFMFLKGKITIG